MNHVMLDLETLGRRAGFVVLAVGAVQFSLDGAVGKTFYANIDPGSCVRAGLKIDPETQAWWKQQPAAAQEALIKDRRPLGDVVREFSNWFLDTGLLYPWGHGAAFDPPIWEAASLAVDRPAPWKFWNVRDTRTVFDLFSFDTRDIVRKGTYHNALDDAVHQVECVVAALRKGRAAAAASVFA